MVTSVTINSFPWQNFSLVIPQQLSNSPTSPGFSQKWSCCVFARTVNTTFNRNRINRRRLLSCIVFHCWGRQCSLFKHPFVLCMLYHTLRQSPGNASTSDISWLLVPRQTVTPGNRYRRAPRRSARTKQHCFALIPITHHHVNYVFTVRLPLPRNTDRRPRPTHTHPVMK